MVLPSIFLVIASPTRAQLNNSLGLDGDLDYATATSASSLNISGQAFTLETWVKYDGASDANAILVDKTDGSASTGGYELGITGEGDEVQVYIDLPAIFSRVTSTRGLPEGRWMHVAATYDGNQVNLYLNGRLEGQTNAGSDIGANSLPLKIGTNTSASNAQFFSGQIDEIRLWSTSRSLLDIRENRFVSLSGNESNLEAYYDFNQPGTNEDQAGGADLTFSGDADTQQTDVFPVPPDVYVRESGNGAISLQWELRDGPNNANEANAYSLYRSSPTGLGGRQKIATLDGQASGLSYRDTALSNGKTYFYEVAAVDSLFVPGTPIGVEGDYSPFVTATPRDGQEPNPLRGGASLSLDGTSDYGRLTDRPSLDIRGNAFTLELWVKHDGESDNDAILVDKTDGAASTGGYELRFVGEGESPRVQADLPAVFSELTSEKGVPAGRWTHIALTYDGNDLNLYLNGVQEAQTGASGAIEGSGLPLVVGANSSAANGQFFSGRIDELALYDRARSISEIQNSYRQRSLGNEDGLKAYWPFNDAGKGVMQDVSTGHGRRRSDMRLEGDANISGPGVFPLPPIHHARHDGMADSVLVFWAPRNARLADSFAVYRSAQMMAGGQRLGGVPGSTTRFADGSANAFSNTFYRLTAYNAQGQESDFSLPNGTNPDTSMLGNALQLDGDNDFARLEDRPSIDVRDNDFTLECWIKYASGSDEDALIVDKTDGSATTGGYQLRLEGRGDSVQIAADLPATFNELTSSTFLQAGAWNHIALTADGNEISLYLNGQLDNGTNYGGGAIEGSGLPFIIGANTSAANEDFFEGQIDELRLWDQARTQSELQNAYQQELRGDETGLQAYWRFNETPGTPIARAQASRPKTLALQGDADFTSANIVSNVKEYASKVDLLGHYPQPVREFTQIRYQLEEARAVQLAVFNLQGQKVRSLVKGPRGPGRHQARLETEGLSPGVYLYRLQTEQGAATRKMIVR